MCLKINCYDITQASLVLLEDPAKTDFQADPDLPVSPEKTDNPAPMVSLVIFLPTRLRLSIKFSSLNELSYVQAHLVRLADPVRMVSPAVPALLAVLVHRARLELLASPDLKV